jgi:hypothetical protein
VRVDLIIGPVAAVAAFGQAERNHRALTESKEREYRMAGQLR